MWYVSGVETWSFLTSHARVLLCIARDPGVRLRDVAASLGITERSAHSLVADLTAAGYLVKQKHGRRNRYRIEAHLRLPESDSREPAIGDVLATLAGHGAGQKPELPCVMPEEPGATGTSDEPGAATAPDATGNGDGRRDRPRGTLPL
jgi:hypothetical protein